MKSYSYLISLTSIIFFMFCSSSINECKTDLDCPGLLVCREYKCVGLYEIDIKEVVDSIIYDLSIDSEIKEDFIDSLDVYGDYDDVTYYDTENIVIDATAFECLIDNDCEKGVVCIESSCIEGICKYSIKEGYCYIGEKCFLKDEKDPSNECRFCNPNLDRYSWSVDEGISCYDEGNECTYDICKAGTCIHPYKEQGLKCKDGICNGKGRCVQCIEDKDCNNSGFDTRCEGYSCNGEGKCEYYTREGQYCGEGTVWECFICLKNSCQCNYPHFNCETCIPSCGFLGGNCCASQSSSCSGEWKESYDCQRCCIGKCAEQ